MLLIGMLHPLKDIHGKNRKKINLILFIELYWNYFLTHIDKFRIINHTISHPVVLYVNICCLVGEYSFLSIGYSELNAVICPANGWS